MIMNTKTLKKTCRLSSDERRDAIVQSAMEIFAEKGLGGATTRDLAKAAGVSEALLYRHFPSKESLYDAVLDSCVGSPTWNEFNRIMKLEASTSTLVILVHFLISHTALHRDPGKVVIDRLLLQSFLGDGEFLRITMKKCIASWVDKFADCLKAADKNGERHDIALQANLAGWLSQHLAMAFTFFDLQAKAPVVSYRMSRENLVVQATFFVLLGAGLKLEVIKQYYNPKALALLKS